MADPDEDDNYEIIEFIEADSDQETSAQESESSDDEVERAPAVEFDIRLPSTHGYLNNVDAVPSEAFYIEPETELEIPILLDTLVLFPGQTLPLKDSDPDFIRVVRSAVENNSCIGLIPKFVGQNCTTGTLFQVRNMSQEDDELKVQAIGRQRFRLCGELPVSGVHLQLTSCLEKIRVKVLDEFSFSPLLQFQDTSINRIPSKKIRNTYLSQFFACQNAVLEQSSTEHVINLLKNWLSRWFNEDRIKLVLDEGLSKFSFWVAVNLPSSVKTKLEILDEDCTDIRLHRVWRATKEINAICCRTCETSIADPNDVIVLSVEGTGIHFVNPHGNVHDLITVSNLKNYLPIGRSSTEFSWFPGYAWTILTCASCRSHLGWKFSSSHLLPKKFFGLTRSSICCSLKPLDIDDESEITIVIDK